MVKWIVPGEKEEYLAEAAAALRAAKHPVALTGAGISVESGIPDFRSPGGLWTVYPPEEYATLDIFHRDPTKAWKLYRAIGRSLEGTRPNPAHTALVRLEAAGRLAGIVTQNVDGLHQTAGNQRVIEIHGDHQHLHCLRCGWQVAVRAGHLQGEAVPACEDCGRPLKPNVVLFGEAVRGLEEIAALLEPCDLLLVIGTSAQVYPAAGLPSLVKDRGGEVFEYNLQATGLTRTLTDYFIEGTASLTLEFLVSRVLLPE